MEITDIPTLRYTLVNCLRLSRLHIFISQLIDTKVVLMTSYYEFSRFKKKIKNKNHRQSTTRIKLPMFVAHFKLAISDNVGRFNDRLLLILKFFKNKY